ncbi:hypothetical protein ACRAWD_16080 [Caulobacter segnis]
MMSRPAPGLERLGQRTERVRPSAIPGAGTNRRRARRSRAKVPPPGPGPRRACAPSRSRPRPGRRPNPRRPPPSAWSSEPRAPAAPSAEDVWGRLARTSEVDWERGFAPAPAATPPASTPAWTPSATGTTPAAEPVRPRRP